MIYLKTYRDKTEHVELNLYTCLIRDLFLNWGTNDVELPVYVYEHLEEFMNPLLSCLSEQERDILELWYQKEVIDDKWVRGIGNFLNLDFDEVVDGFFEALRKIRDASDDLYYLSYGAHKNFPLTSGWEDADDSDGYIERWMEAEQRRQQLKRQVIKEVNAYADGVEGEHIYLPKILEKQTVSQDRIDSVVDPEKSIDELDLSVRAYNCLHRAGILNVGQLMELDAESLGNIRNLTGKARREVEDVQIDIRSGWFFRQDKNVFECKFPTPLTELLLNQGYFFWKGIKNELDQIDALLAENGLEKYRKPFADFAQEQFVREASGSEKVVLTFQKDLDINWLIRHKIFLTEELKEYFSEGAVIFPGKGNYLRVVRPERFEKMISGMEKNGDRHVHMMMRSFVGTSEYVELDEGDPLILPERLMKYMQREYDLEEVPVLFIASLCHTEDADYIIGIPNMVEWEENQKIQPMIRSGQLYFHRMSGMTQEEWENTLWIRVFFPTKEKSWYYRELYDDFEY